MSEPETGQGTVTRVIQMLSYLAQVQETSIKEVSQALGLAPSTCHRLLDLLMREGMVERDPRERRYRIGVEFFRIAALAQQHFDIRRVAQPILESVVAQCDETCVLSLYDPALGRMIYAEKRDSGRMLRYQLPLNKPISLLWGSSGRAIAAYLPDETVRKIYAGESAAPASGEPLPPFALLQDQLRRIREDGFAVSFGQKIAGAVGINAPVFGANDGVVGSLGITIPEVRVSDANMERLTTLVMEAAATLSAQIGRPGKRAKPASSLPAGEGSRP